MGLLGCEIRAGLQPFLTYPHHNGGSNVQRMSTTIHSFMTTADEHRML